MSLGRKNLICVFDPWTRIYYQTSKKNWVKFASYMFQGSNLELAETCKCIWGHGTCVKLILYLMSFHQMFCSVFIFRGQIHIMRFSHHFSISLNHRKNYKQFNIIEPQPSVSCLLYCTYVYCIKYKSSILT